jgi:anaerobic selenocysteine-containing dehydrogenase
MGEIQTSICRFCHAHCGIKVEIEDGRAIRVYGDKDNPVYHGYSCAKGRALPETHANPDRLRSSMKRRGDGSFESIPSEQAMDEVALRLQSILDRHGPRSMAVYLGTYAAFYPASIPIATSWMREIGSPMIFTSATIDQPGKPIATALHGRWQAGPYLFDEADVWMLVGSNPLVAMSNGIPNSNPARHLHRAKKRGLKLIVIDPRVTECARAADLHLQPRPGEDPTLLAGLIRVITREGLHDADFVSENASGFEALCEAVEPFTPEYVGRRADVPAAQLIEAARLFAQARRAGANAGTGPNMAGRGNLTEYLMHALHTVCGHWLKAGEVFTNPFALLPAYTPKAQPDPPSPAWGYGEELRVRGLTDAVCGLPTAALADEILLQGEGQVRALICVGGNPMAAWPDQLKTHAAMQDLELLVTIDPKMSATARLADYVIAPKICLEVPGLSLLNEALWFYGVGLGYPAPYAQYTPARVDPPPGSDLVEDWEFFHGLARRMGLGLRLDVTHVWDANAEGPRWIDVDMDRRPTTDELFAHLTHGSRVPLEEVKQHPHGAIFGERTQKVQPRDDHCEARLELANPVMLGELSEVRAEPLDRDADFRFRLVSRRLPDVLNSCGHDIPRLTRRYRYNPAFMNPGDLEALGLSGGDVVEIESDHASILGVVESAPDVKAGVISMTHCFGDAPGSDGDVRSIGSNTGRLTPVERDYDPYTGIPRMSAIPVNVRRSRQPQGA